MSERRESPRVLVVDADVTNRGAISEALARAGFETRTAATGERALMMLREWPRRIDWLYTRTELPGLIDGWMLADEFHQAHPDRPVLHAVSPNAEPPLQAQAILLENPVSPTAVVDVLHRLIPRARITALAA